MLFISACKTEVMEMAKVKKQKKQRKQETDWKSQLTYELLGLIIVAIASVAIANLGAVGVVLIRLFRFFFGEWYILLLLGLFAIGLYLIIKRKKPPFFTRRLIGIYVISAAILLTSHVKLFELLSNDGTWNDPSVIRNTWELYWLEVRGDTGFSDLGGGMVGSLLFAISHILFDTAGTKIIVFFIGLIGFLLLTGRSLNSILIKPISVMKSLLKNYLLRNVENIKANISDWKKARQNRRMQKANETSRDEVVVVDHMKAEKEAEVFEEPIISNFADVAYHNESEQLHFGNLNDKVEKEEQKQQNIKAEKGKEEIQVSLSLTEIENEDYQLPPSSILAPPKQNGQQMERQMMSANAKKLEKTFQSFGVKAKVAKVHLGPAVTKYEVYPDVGVKVSKIVNLSDDLALALAAKDIRIEAPIPGKSAIGIEVPNQEVAMVSLREVLDSKNNQGVSKLMVGLGRDISGDAVLAELNKMPHLLVAGATGSGKSVCINGIVVSILMKAKPHEVKLMMIDPKMVELNVYNGIPHLLAPVVTDPKKASQALKKVVAEMERRYDLFSHSGTRNIEGYNDYINRHNAETNEKQPTLPYIVVIVDELADLMMVASGDVEDAITRLAQMARAAGIHLIIATQRPSVDVITGVIKANIPSRIAFSVSSQTDSRTILDMGGAEKLLGRGDMLFIPVGASKPVRVQGAFLSDEEVEKVVDFVISQQKAQYQEEMIPTEETSQDVKVDDDLFDDAVELVVEMQTASVSMLQRRFRIGYTRAARLIDAMEAKGIVGPYEGSKPRSVLVSKSEEEATS